MGKYPMTGNRGSCRLLGYSHGGGGLAGAEALGKGTKTGTAWRDRGNNYSDSFHLLNPVRSQRARESVHMQDQPGNNQCEIMRNVSISNL